MNKTLKFAIMALIAIILVSSFGLQLFPENIVSIPTSSVGQELYVCPTANSTWDSIATGMRPFTKYIMIGFFFAVMMLGFVWGWALYQNLLKDSFKKDAYTNAWKATKAVFWAGIIVLLLVRTPNYFRTVHILGASGDWVLCENNSPNARAVMADSVQP